MLHAAIGNAVAILTDVEKRKQYDKFGPEGGRIQTREFERTVKIHLLIILLYIRAMNLDH